MTATSRRSRRRWLRRALIWGGASFTVLVVALASLSLWMFRQASIDTIGAGAFVEPLPIPPIAEHTRDPRGRIVFDLAMQRGVSQLRPGIDSETWGVNGPLLGPTVRVSRGDEVVMRVTNELGEPSTLHWHGMHLPAAADGGPHQVIEPGETWAPTWTIDQPAATLWYHPHPHGATADHVNMGIAGLLIIDDDQTPEGIPREYGIDDVPVIIQDTRFHSDGSLNLDARPMSSVGALGDTILVNGVIEPYHHVSTERVRLRVLNGSSGRVYNLGFDDDRRFALIATDGGLLPRPHLTERIQLTPGERAEILVEMQPGEQAVLRSYRPDLGANWFSGRFAGGDDRFDLLELRAATSLVPVAALATTLADDDLVDPGSATRTRRFELGDFRHINGQTMDMHRVDEVVATGSTELWEVTNRSGTPHNFHIHDVRFRVVHIDGQPPPPHLGGPKDTVYVPPGTTLGLAVRFGRYADPLVPYMYHCHILAHEDSGMMGQFIVVAPDEVVSAPRRLPSDHGH